MIYFVLAETLARVKIGYTESQPIRTRIDDLQTGSPVQLRLLCAIDGGRNEESQLHYRFAADRLHGEWFRLSPALAAYLARFVVSEPRLAIFTEALSTATDGPWIPCGDHIDECNGLTFAKAYGAFDSTSHDTFCANAKLMARAREAVPYLIEKIRLLQELLDIAAAPKGDK